MEIEILTEECVLDGKRGYEPCMWSQNQSRQREKNERTWRKTQRKIRATPSDTVEFYNVIGMFSSRQECYLPDIIAGSSDVVEAVFVTSG
ncbi:hypothetical protein E2C01_015168 [Portunus trituberculatus]|uniref:Uncharacterized protein n=1 Tax=Portunus trituberculatus TaxID=210409 RepID=A0A5B7DKL5_PORTR|nr:hypothetical protein [Portunus trituberculatus]